MSFERELSGYRYVETFFGDTLRRVALREMGDASHWIDIALINGLVEPYLTDDASQVRPGVLLTGSTLLVPASQSTDALSTNPDELFGSDICLNDGKFVFSDGDLATSSGEKNIVQAIRHRLSTEKQALLYHPTYGCYTHMLRGRGNGPITVQLAAFYARSALLEDPRVADVVKCTAEAVGDQLRIDADVAPIAGKQISFTMVV